MDKNSKKKKLSLLFKSFLKSKALLYLVLILFLFKLSAFLIFVSFPEDIFFADITKSSLVNMLNQTRESLGIKPLQENEDLDAAAALKAQDMIRNEYFSHISPSGTTPWHWFYEAGYNYKYAGENLAIGFYDSSEVFEAWLGSSSHKENMVNPAYSEVGTAILSGFGENNAIIVVQLFGYPKSVAIAKEQSIGPKPEETSVLATESKALTEQKDIDTPQAKETDARESQENSRQGKVLSSSISIKKYENTSSDSLYSKFLNLFLYGNNIIFGSLVYIFILILFVIIGYVLVSDYNDSFIDRGLILRSVLLIGLLTFSAVINKDLIILIIPHKIII